MNYMKNEILREKLGTTILISIGIDYYNDYDNFSDLSKCVNDARTIYRIYENEEAYNFCNTKSCLILGESYSMHPSAGKEVILKKVMSVIDNLEVSENLVLFYSGHGYRKDNKFYIVPQDSIDLTVDTMIDFQEIINCLDKCKAKTKVVLLDACFSGTKIKDAKSLSDQSFKFLKEYFDATKGIAVISSSASEEYSSEFFPDSNLSLFTHFLSEALRGKQEALDSGFLTVQSLFGYVNENVIRKSREYMGVNQKPTIDIKSNSKIVLGIFRKFDDGNDIYKNSCTINWDKKDDVFKRYESSLKVFLDSVMWQDTIMLIKELIINSFTHGKANMVNIQFSRNQISLYDNGEKFDITKQLIYLNDKNREGNSGAYFLQYYMSEYKDKINISYTESKDMNCCTLAFLMYRAFDIDDICTIKIDSEQVESLLTTPGLFFPEALCEKYFFNTGYYLCVSQIFNVFRVIFDNIPTSSKLVIMDEFDIYRKHEFMFYKYADRIIYRPRY